MTVGGSARLERADCAAERLSSIDDQATRTEQLFLEDELQRRAERAAREPVHLPGICTNCGAQCAALAVYCDADCRSDHEWIESVRLRTGATR